MTKFLIRPARLDDIPHIRQVARETWEDTFRGRLSPELIAEILERNYSRPRLEGDINAAAAFLVAEAGSVVGYCHFCWRVLSGAVRGTELSRLYLLPSWQSQGLGRSLLRMGLTDLGEGAYPVSLTVEKENWRARRFYERFGFTQTGGRTWLLKNGVIELTEYVLTAASSYSLGGSL